MFESFKNITLASKLHHVDTDREEDRGPEGGGGKHAYFA